MNMAASHSDTDKVLAAAEIQALIISERYYRDSEQWDKLRASWHPDDSKTRVNISWYQGSVSGFVEGSRQMVARGTRATHSICPVEISINGNKAVSESTGSINIRFEHKGVLFDLTSVSRFQSRLQFVDGAWKLLSLNCIYDYDKISPAFPVGAISLEIPEFSRPSYRCLAWTLARNGAQISDSLPGLDRPESIAELREKDNTWLTDMQGLYI